MRRTLTKKRSEANIKSNKRSSIKSTISSPIALISTTNMLSYTSPSLRLSHSHSSLSSSSSGSPTYPHFPPSPLSSSGDDTDLESPHINKPLSPIYHRPAPVPPPVTRAQSTRVPASKPQTHQRRPSVPVFIPPVSPPRSMERQQPPRVQPRGSLQPHPFGAELAQVEEMAEEIGAMRDPEADEMERKGLLRFGASDYEAEIYGLLGNVYEDRLPVGGGWI